MPDFVHALSLTALVAATLEYAILVRHREERRDAVRWQAEVRESLVSFGRSDATHVRRWTDDARHEKRWTDDGTRFRAER